MSHGGAVGGMPSLCQRTISCLSAFINPIAAATELFAFCLLRILPNNDQALDSCAKGLGCSNKPDDLH